MELGVHKKAFGSIAKNYSKFRKHHSTKLYDLLFSLTSDNPAVLDVGCGTGNSTEALTERASRVVGIDHDVAALKIITEEAGGKATDLDGNERRYDQKGLGFVISNGRLHQAILEIIKQSKF